MYTNVMPILYTIDYHHFIDLYLHRIIYIVFENTQNE